MKKFKVVSIFLLFCLLFMHSSTGIVNAVGSKSINSNGITGDEEKVYCDATLEDDFYDDCVHIVMTNAASLASFDYDATDFPEVGCISVTNLTQAKTDKVKTKILGESISEYYSDTDNIVLTGFYQVDTESFHQVLSLELANPSKENVLAAIDLLEQRNDILYAGPNYIYSVDSKVLCSTYPNDTHLNQQWAIEKISLPRAWDICTGSTSVLVGVIDSGISSTHAEFNDRVSTTYSAICQYDNQYQTVTNPTDSIGHGTMVAGIIGAAGNDGRGISGVNWNVTLVSLRVCSDSLASSSGMILSAINRAESLGIGVVNISLGVSNYAGDLRAAIDNYSGLVVCASGNENQDLATFPNYPARFDVDDMIVVGASTEDDTIWTETYQGSNYGDEEVDLFAPGENILTCYPCSLCNVSETHTTGDGSEHYDYGYHIASGTSFAAPYVTGVASLLLGMYSNQTMSKSALCYHILNGVDVKSAFQGKCVTGGRLNAYKVLSTHVLTFFYEADGSAGHYSYCQCSGNRFEDHNFSEIGGLWVCSDCGFAY